MPKSDTIYIMKCMGIMMVILIHTITYQQPVFYDNQLVCMAKTTLMPTFLALGGYLIAGKKLDDSWMLRKTIKWGSIIAVCTIVYWIWANLMPQWSMYKNELSLGNYLIDSVMRGFSSTVMWYLFVMLCCYAILWLAYKVRINRTIMTIGIIIVLTLIPFYLFQFGHVKWYGLFLFLGYIVGLNKDKLKKWVWLAYPAIVGFALAWILTNGMTNWQDLEYGNGGYTIITNALSAGKWQLVLVMFSVSCIGIMAVIGVSKLLSKVKYLSKGLAFIGTCTLGIYIIHPLFIGISGQTWAAYLLTAGISFVLYNVANYTYRQIKPKLKLEAVNA